MKCKYCGRRNYYSFNNKWLFLGLAMITTGIYLYFNADIITITENSTSVYYAIQHPFMSAFKFSILPILPVMLMWTGGIISIINLWRKI